MNTTTQQQAPSAQSATQSARQVLALLSDYAVRNELEKFFAREWEIATGLTEAREAFEAAQSKADDETEELGRKYDALEDAARELVHAVDEADEKRIDEAVKAVESLL